jgi:predicted aspartyl protease
MAGNVETIAYSSAYLPPAPVVEIRVEAPGRARRGRSLTALIDSGADATLIPIDMLEEVGARHVGDATLRGWAGDRYPADIYLVNLIIGVHALPAVRVAAVPSGTEPVLGRNALNHLIITLNGPAAVTEIAA